ncbi:penicillin-binding protein 2 [Paralimibaculum aggregatum]|uniref:Penicillin-binding protein 2 n=1 Tax=Paralimibaculum aggregatum TaxID=3036245 RepID=A0ABQ6LP93_9RHOB|nr:penicillin-binding protein 2 [Limibaculum sp. NKW23]GMG84110.1 penicillin-binding protein 2 [Limibaculum sp. NKW23]
MSRPRGEAPRNGMRIRFGDRARPDRAEGPGVTRRGLVLLGAQLLVAGGLAWRMRQFQIVEGEHYRLLAEENRINMRLIAPTRGQIFDRKNQPLAINQQNFRVVMIREQAGDPEAALDRLGRIVEISPRARERVLDEIRSKSAFVPVVVAEHLDWDTFAKINVNAPALPGILPEVGLSRHYPAGPETAHVVGYVGRVTQKDLDQADDQDPVLQIPEFQIGKRGLERGLERKLRGQAGTRRIEVNALGRVIRELDRVEGQPGPDLHLTLDLALQDYANWRLREESGAAVLLDLRHGDVLAMASTPSFEPNLFVRGISGPDYKALLEHEYRPLHNKWASGMYPPGSTFKMVVALAALEDGVIAPEETVFCNGGYELGNRRFHCWRRGGHGHVAQRAALEQSCDVYFYEAAKRVGIERIAAMAQRLGLGQRADMPLPELKGGLIPDKAWKSRNREEPWLVGDTLNAGIGQGFVLATPLQLAVMTARLATGRALEPRLILARDGRPAPVPEAAPLGIAEAHLALVRRGMFDVVNSRRGTARRARIDDKANRMAGKTGTSQVRNITKAERALGVFRNEDLPWRRRDHALFVGYAPYEDPRFAVAVVVEHGGGGSKAAAPVARDILMRGLWGGEPPLTAYPPGQAPERPVPTPQPRPVSGDGNTPPRIRT